MSHIAVDVSIKNATKAVKIVVFKGFILIPHLLRPVKPFFFFYVIYHLPTDLPDFLNLRKLYGKIKIRLPFRGANLKSNRGSCYGYSGLDVRKIMGFYINILKLQLFALVIVKNLAQQFVNLIYPKRFGYISSGSFGAGFFGRIGQWIACDYYHRHLRVAGAYSLH